MLTELAMMIRIHRLWDGWRSAEVPLHNLEGLHWRQPDGAPCAMLHAFVWCTPAINGDLDHDCDGVIASHRLSVCILKHDLLPTLYATLAKRADGAPTTTLESPQPLIVGDDDIVRSSPTGLSHQPPIEPTLSVDRTPDRVDDTPAASTVTCDRGEMNFHGRRRHLLRMQ